MFISFHINTWLAQQRHFPWIQFVVFGQRSKEAEQLGLEVPEDRSNRWVVGSFFLGELCVLCCCHEIYTAFEFGMETNTAAEVLTPALDAMRDEEVWWDRSDGTVPCNSQVGTRTGLYFFSQIFPWVEYVQYWSTTQKSTELSWDGTFMYYYICIVGPSTDKQFYISLLESPRWGTRPMQLTCFII